MCGITGWFALRRDLRSQRAVVDAMTETMACRGLDARGTWVGAHAALGHRGLAVIDLSGRRQPMSVQTPDGPVVLVYSGETYNFTEPRGELAGRGHRLDTRSDTEVVPHAYLERGAALAERLNGMHPFAVWDSLGNELVMIRYRLGIKPLYYYPTANDALFDPELPFPRPLGVQVMHAHKDASPVPKTQSSLRTVNGVRLVTTRRSAATVLFRRLGRW